MAEMWSNFKYCDICHQPFKEAFSLLKHKMESHSVDNEPKKDFICEFCDMTFGSETKLKEHRKIYNHNRKDTWPCHVCGETFMKASKLLKHKRLHKESLKMKFTNHYKIDKCFDTSLVLKRSPEIIPKNIDIKKDDGEQVYEIISDDDDQNMEIEDAQPKEHEITSQDKTFNMALILNHKMDQVPKMAHITDHSPSLETIDVGAVDDIENDTMETDTLKDVIDTFALQDDIETKIKPYGGLVFLCSECQEEFDHLSDLRNHRQSCLKPEKPQPMTNITDSEPSNAETDLKNDTMETNASKWPFICKVTDIINDDDGIETHPSKHEVDAFVRKAFGLAIVIFVCSGCGDEFDLYSDLQNHRQSCLEAENSPPPTLHKCDLCDAQFIADNSEDLLKSHTDLMHGRPPKQQMTLWQPWITS